MDTTFRELSAEERVESVPLSHLSIELGHLYMEDFAAGPDRLRAQFSRVAGWAAAARQSCQDVRGRRPRVSTCFLIDDYFTRFSTPAEVLPSLLETAGDAGLEIDYIARESGCAVADDVPVAETVAGRLSPIPPQGSNGSRPPVSEIGWLCNGERSPATATEGTEAMSRPTWAPPHEIGARNHSVFVDVELWRDQAEDRLWSCAFLAAVWQLLRLGVLRYRGASVARPQQWSGEFPTDWDKLPPLVQTRQGAAPFSAYRTFSVLPARFLPTEQAVRTILGQVTHEAPVLNQLIERARGEGVELPLDLTSRIDYLFFNE